MPRERGFFLKNLADFQTELGRVTAGYLPGVEDWTVRKELPLQIFQDFRIVQDIRHRFTELGVGGGAEHRSRAVPARALLEKLCEAPTSQDAFWAIYTVVKPALADAIKEGLASRLGIYDLPSIPLLEANIELLRKQTEWGRGAMARLDEASGEASEEFRRDVQAAAAQLTAELSRTERGRAERLRQSRTIGRLPLLDGTVPRGFAQRDKAPPRSLETYADRERHYAANFLQEVQAADSCAAMLFDAPDLPWEFYFDCARHMWDESRHAMFGEKKLAALKLTPEEIGLSMTAYRMRQTISTVDRYAALTTQEADAFPGKHEGLREALAHNDALGAMTWSYDIADETQHVRYGQKWLPVMIEGVGDPRSLEQVRGDACNWRDTVLLAAYRPELRAGAGVGARS